MQRFSVKLGPVETCDITDVSIPLSVDFPLARLPHSFFLIRCTDEIRCCVTSASCRSISVCTIISPNNHLIIEVQWHKCKYVYKITVLATGTSGIRSIYFLIDPTCYMVEEMRKMSTETL